jgi:membrane protease YdiL (CAAX protease family)
MTEKRSKKGALKPPSNREAVLVVIASFFLVGVFSYLPYVVPFLAPYSSVLIAAAFIYLPVLVVWRRGATLDEIGVTLRLTWTRLATLLVVCCLVFPLFTIGFFGYHALCFQRSPCIDIERLRAWPETLRSPEIAPASDGLVLARPAQGKLVLSNKTREPAVIIISWEGAQAYLATPAGTTLIPGPGKVTLQPTHRILWTSQGRASVTIDGRAELREAGGNTPDLPYTANRGFWWIVTMFCVQLLMVALPEELFYRGYLQTRLSQRFRRPVMLFGGDVGPAVMVTSAIFALGHLIAIPAPGRLAVFFPSILFGWLRSRTGTIWPSVVLHALSNVILAALNTQIC